MKERERELTVLGAFEKASCLAVNSLWTGPMAGDYYRPHLVTEDFSPTSTRN